MTEWIRLLTDLTNRVIPVLVMLLRPIIIIHFIIKVKELSSCIFLTMNCNILNSIYICIIVYAIGIQVVYLVIVLVLVMNERGSHTVKE